MGHKMPILKSRVERPLLDVRPVVATFAILAFLFAPVFSEETAKPPTEAERARAEFEALLNKIRTAKAGEVTEAEARQMLAQASSIGRPFAANQAIKVYFKSNLNPSPGLLLLAAQVGERSGDFRGAVSRYKTYLANATPSRESSEAAARMYELMVDFLGTYSDAYQSMLKLGATHRHSMNARKYDNWFIRKAIEWREFEDAARRLTIALASASANDRHFYSDSISQLIQTVAHSIGHDVHLRDKLIKSVPDLKRLASQITDPSLRQHYALFAAFMDFYAQRPADSREHEKHKQLFKPVYAAARAWIDKESKTATVMGILRIVSGSESGTEWSYAQAGKRALLLYAFSKVSNGDRIWIYSQSNWSWIVPTDSHPQLVALVPWLVESARDKPGMIKAIQHLNPNQFAPQAAKIKDSTQTYAVIIRMLSAGADPARCIDQMMASDGWHLDFQQPYQYITEYFWPNFSHLYKDQSDLSKVILHYGQRYLSRSPIAVFDQTAAAETIRHAWRVYGPDVNRLSPIFHLLDWVPYTAEERKEVFQRAADEFNNWAEVVRKDVERYKAMRSKSDDEKKKEQEALASLKKINPVDALFKTVLNPDIANSAMPPSPLCQHLAAAVKALRSKNQKAFIASARVALPLLSRHQQRKIPYGRACVQFLLGSHLKEFDTFDFQLETLEKQLKTLQLNQWNPDVEATLWAMSRGRSGWPSSAPRNEQPKIQKVNRLLSDALLQQLEKGKFWPPLFNWMRMTRKGNGWTQQGWSNKAMEKLIAGKVFYKNNYKPVYPGHSVTRNYQYLLASDFSNLNAKYNKESYFDDDFIAECKKTGKLDYTYWEHGRDHDGKVREYAASLMEAGQIPAGTDFYNWYQRLLSSRQRTSVVKSLAANGKAPLDARSKHFYWLQMPGDLKDEARRKEYFQRLKAFSADIASHPSRFAYPSLGTLTSIKPKDFTDEELNLILGVFKNASNLTRRYRDAWGRYYYLDLISILQKALTAKGRENDFFQVIPYFWQIANDLYNYDQNTARSTFEQIQSQVVQLMEQKKYELAAAYSLTGLELSGSRLPQHVRITLMNARSKAVSDIGGIPVSRTDQRYPLFQSQVAFLGGNLDSAWELYTSNRRLIEKTYLDLDLEYLIWLVERHTELKAFGESGRLSQLLIRWVDSNPKAFDRGLRAQLYLAYANIAFARQEYPRARAQYERIKVTPDFRDTRAAKMASLRIAAVDRLTKNYEQAIRTLEKLSESNDHFLRVESFYQLAITKFGQEEFDDAGAYLDRVMVLSPDHHNAKILMGKLDLKRKKLIEATEIDLGITATQRIIVPGKPLKLKLEDRNLAIVGKTTNIEVRAWTSTGDEEFFNLFSFGDSKTRFEGRILTTLGAVQPGDQLLQILGNDKVHYDFSDKFKKKANIKSAADSVGLTVVTDGEFQASAGRIPTKEELEKLTIERLLKLESDKSVLSVSRQGNQIRPGNSIYVRVTDPDRCVTEQPDSVTISITTSSGDRLPALGIQETEATTGVFEGSVKTAAAQATAFATDTMAGRQPNFVISPRDYPAWVAEPNNRRPKAFTIDLNDNVLLGGLNLRSEVEGRKLTEYLVQTSFDNKSFKTVGWWPKEFKPWDGKLHLELARSSATVMDESTYLEWGHTLKKVTKISMDMKQFKISWDSNRLRNDGALKNAQAYGYRYVARVRGAFYSPRRQRRTFTLKHPELASSVTYSFSIDEEVPTAENPDVIRIVLDKGVHLVQLTIQGDYRNAISFELNQNTEEPPFTAPVPGEIFDQEKNPQIAREYSGKPTDIEASEDKKSFDITFPEDVRARIVRFLILDYETDAPAISKVTLKNRAGKQLLPTVQDFMDLMKNDILEIIPGDRIVLRYTDPKFISRGRGAHEQFMNVTYHNATLSASFVDFQEQGTDRVASYVPIVRFKPGEPIVVFVNDPDADISPRRDTVDFNTWVTGKDPVNLKALETKENSGVFTSRIFPVETEPERETDLKVTEDDTIQLSYLDKENTDPGIPWERKYKINQVFYQDPEMRVFDVESVPLDQSEAASVKEKPSHREKSGLVEKRKVLPKALVITRPEKPEYEKPAQAVIDGPLIAEVIFPTIVLSPRSKAVLYAQTSSGREGFGNDPAKAFDIRVPGTIAIEQTPGASWGGGSAQGYAKVVFNSDSEVGNALEDGIFTFSIPAELGDVPDHSPAAGEMVGQEKSDSNTLKIKGGDKIYVGFKYQDEAGAEHWLTREIQLKGDAFFEVLDRKYEDPLTGIHVGEAIYLRVFDKMKDISAEKDAVRVELNTAGGRTLTVELIETFEHTGEFRGILKPVYAEQDGNIPEDRLGVTFGDQIVATYRPLEGERAGLEKLPAEIVKTWHTYQKAVDENRYAKASAADEDTIRLKVRAEKNSLVLLKSVIARKFPTDDPAEAKETYTSNHKKLKERFGTAKALFDKQDEDDVPLDERKRYTPGLKADDANSVSRTVQVYKGDDGDLATFTKRFKDEEIAVQTQFTIAEAYFELAKKHRKLKQIDLARKEINQGKRLLEEAIRDFPDTETRAQADYLLANLSLEFAEEAKEEKLKKKFYMEAITRFTDIVASSSESSYAPKSQYKKALTYEKMGLLDQACEEYVKLSYRYPNNELVAETIARLGQYFWKKGKEFKEEGIRLADEVEKYKSFQKSKNMYRTSGEVFGRLPARFPSHRLSGKTTVLSGQAYIQAEMYGKAIETLASAIKKFEGDKRVAPEAMYWLADTYVRRGNDKDLVEAYRTFKKLTWDYPASKWAKYARGRLTEDVLTRIGERAMEGGE